MSVFDDLTLLNFSIIFGLTTRPASNAFTPELLSRRLSQRYTVTIGFSMSSALGSLDGRHVPSGSQLTPAATDNRTHGLNP